MFVSITLLNAQVAVQMFILTKTTIIIIKLWVYNKNIKNKSLNIVCIIKVHRKKLGLLFNYFLVRCYFGLKMWDYQNCLLRNPYIQTKLNNRNFSLTKLKLDYKNMINKIQHSFD